VTAQIINLQEYRIKKYGLELVPDRLPFEHERWLMSEDRKRRREDFERNGSHRYTDDWSECPF